MLRRSPRLLAKKTSTRPSSSSQSKKGVTGVKRKSSTHSKNQKTQKKLKTSTSSRKKAKGTGKSQKGNGKRKGGTKKRKQSKATQTGKARSSRKESNSKSRKSQNGKEKSSKQIIDDQIKINRAPVLTIWVAVVAEALGYSWETGLTLGKAVAGQFAFSKGRSIGLMESSGKTKEERKRERGKHFMLNILTTKVPCRQGEDGIRALQKGKPINSDNVQRYLEQKFGGEENVKKVKGAMGNLTDSYNNSDELNQDAYRLYTLFRPTIPAGERGWGRRGILDLQYVQSLDPSAT